MNAMAMFATMSMMNELLFPTFSDLQGSFPTSKRHVSVKFGGGITDMRGSIAGNVFSRNRSGSYMRARTKPINPNTARQVAVRTALAFLTDRWSNTLTALQRAAWDLYASNVVMTNKLGESMHLSGYNHYLRSNVPRKQVALAVIDAGPVVFELPAQDPTFAVTGSEATTFLSNAFDVAMDWAVEDGSYIFFYEGQPQNAQRNFFGGPWRYLVHVAGIDPGGPGSPVVTASTFGIAEGQHVWVYARISRADGRLSEPFRDDDFIAA